MSQFAFRYPAFRRSGLLGIVVAVHALIGGGLWTLKSVAPQLLETPLIVDLLQPPPAMPQEQPVPKPAVRLQPTAPKTPSTPQLPIEATQSAVPSISAPAAVIAPPAPPAPPGDALSPARFDADFLRNSAPAYPEVSRRRGEEGKVMLRVLVAAQGVAEAIEIRTSSGSSRLDEAALKTVKTWKFIPAKRGELPVQSWVLVPIIFRLEL